MNRAQKNLISQWNGLQVNSVSLVATSHLLISVQSKKQN